MFTTEAVPTTNILSSKVPSKDTTEWTSKPSQKTTNIVTDIWSEATSKGTELGTVEPVTTEKVTKQGRVVTTDTVSKETMEVSTSEKVQQTKVYTTELSSEGTSKDVSQEKTTFTTLVGMATSISTGDTFSEAGMAQTTSFSKESSSPTSRVTIEEATKDASPRITPVVTSGEFAYYSANNNGLFPNINDNFLMILIL